MIKKFYEYSSFSDEIKNINIKGLEIINDLYPLDKNNGLGELSDNNVTILLEKLRKKNPKLTFKIERITKPNDFMDDDFFNVCYYNRLTIILDSISLSLSLFEGDDDYFYIQYYYTFKFDQLLPLINWIDKLCKLF